MLKWTKIPPSSLVDLCCANVDKQRGRSPSVIVIGGGMAGIAAARALHDASFQVFKQIKSFTICSLKFVVYWTCLLL